MRNNGGGNLKLIIGGAVLGLTGAWLFQKIKKTIVISFQTNMAQDMEKYIQVQQERAERIFACMNCGTIRRDGIMEFNLNNIKTGLEIKAALTEIQIIFDTIQKLKSKSTITDEVYVQIITKGMQLDDMLDRAELLAGIDH